MSWSKEHLLCMDYFNYHLHSLIFEGTCMWTQHIQCINSINTHCCDVKCKMNSWIEIKYVETERIFFSIFHENYRLVLSCDQNRTRQVLPDIYIYICRCITYLHVYCDPVVRWHLYWNNFFFSKLQKMNCNNCC